MPSVADLLEPLALERLTGGDEYGAGRALAESGAVKLVEFGPLRVLADVVDRGRSARVDLQSSDGSLDWRCRCRGLPAGACRHVAAAGIVTWRRAPKRTA
jgi:uncharacterized Zn finger protein